MLLLDVHQIHMLMHLTTQLVPCFLAALELLLLLLGLRVLVHVAVVFV